MILTGSLLFFFFFFFWGGWGVGSGSEEGKGGRVQKSAESGTTRPIRN